MNKVVIKKLHSDKMFEGLKKVENIEIYAFTDSQPQLWGEEENGYPICSIYKVAELYSKQLIHKIIFSSDIDLNLLDRMVQEVSNLGIRYEDIWIIKPEFYLEPLMENICMYKQYKRLPYIEFHVADHCNLNCKGCVHFSPLVKQQKFVEYETVKKDLLQLKKIVSYIDKIHILGGEPFLNKELDRFIYLVHDVYPFSKVNVVTNGMLLMQMSEKVVKAFQNTGTWIEVSVYPPVLNKIDEIITFVREKGIKICCSEPIYEFDYMFDNNGQHSQGVRQINCSCPNLYEGHLAVCPPIAYMSYFNEYFDEKFAYEDGLINIYDENLTYDGLVEELHKVRQICDKCLFISKEDRVPMVWKQSSIHKDISDYVYVEGE